MNTTSEKPTRSLTHCSAIRCNDQMICKCGLQWDVDDPEPPECPREGADPFAKLKKDLEDSQESLGAEFQKVLDDKYWNLIAE